MNIDIFGHSLIGDSHSIQSPTSAIPFTSTGDYDIEEKRLWNIGTAVEGDDAVNFNYLNNHLNEISSKFEKTVNQIEFEKFKAETSHNFEKTVERSEYEILEVDMIQRFENKVDKKVFEVYKTGIEEKIRTLLTVIYEINDVLKFVYSKHKSVTNIMNKFP